MINNISDSKKILTIDDNDNDVILRMIAVMLNINNNNSNDRDNAKEIIIVYEN